MSKISMNRNSRLLDITLLSLQIICIAIIFSGMWLHSKHEKLLIVPLIIWAILSVIAYGVKRHTLKIKNEKSTQYLLAFLIIVNLIDVLGYGFLHSTFVRGTTIVFSIFVLYNHRKYSIDTATILISLSILPSIIYCIGFYLVNGDRPYLVNPNSFALLFSLTAVYFLFIGTNKKSVTILKSSLAVLCLVCILIMYSRAALFALIASISFTFVISNIKNIKKTSLFFILLSMVSLAFYYSGLSDKLIDKTERQLSLLGKDMNSSDGFRLQSYQLGFDLIKERPIIGWGNNISRRSKEIFIDGNYTKPFMIFFNNSSYAHFHNIYIDITVRFGLIGLILLIIPIGLSLNKAYKSKDDLLLGYTIFFIVIGFFDSIFVFGTSLILLSSLILTSRKNNES
ncbi:O-antigen ligase family protein [Vibrio breoganii]